ncbi:MAG: hypothetical protein B0A82_08520 [Alkalinema sp. CACIAM 70d]|nr:MAG: hypothetical protein B0A82_08520 [Alkalinema sp. CACIAM 70d]
MPTRILIAIFLALLSGASCALDDNDAGAYAVVDKSGLITTKVFRVTKAESGWGIEDRKSDGSWSSVTCVDGCRLGISSPSDIHRFFNRATLEQIVPDCVHDKAFAFCRYALTGNSLFRGYLLVALTEAQPISLRLAKIVKDQPKAPEVLAAAKQNYQRSCVVCHLVGAVGAPRTGRLDDWGLRYRQPTEVLYQHAIEGFKACPPRGGIPSLTDQELRDVVDYMLAQTGNR